MKNKNQSFWCAVLMAAVLFFAGANVSGELVGLWEFSNSSNFGEATLGQDLVLTGSELAVDGIGAGDGAVRLGNGTYYQVTNPIGANGGGTKTNQWTLLYDFRYGQVRTYGCLLQTDLVARANGGELYTRTTGGIGAGSYSPDVLLRYQWHRLIVRVNNGTFYELWVDGVKVLSQVKAIDSIYALQEVFYIRGDKDVDASGTYTQEEDTDFSTVALWNGALREDQIVALGGPETPVAADRFDVLASDGSMAVIEGATSDGYTLELLKDPFQTGVQAWPTSSVTVTLATDGQVTVSPATVVFPAWTGDPNDYKVEITVTPVDDAVQEGDHTGTVSHAAVSADSRWDACPIKDIAVSITDNDGPADVIFSKNTLWVGEGCDPNDQYTCQLYSRPTAGQTVTVSINAGSQCIAIPSSLVFTTSDWYIPQSVTIQAIDNSVVEGPHFSTIAHSIVSGDPAYASLSMPAFPVTIGDNEAQGPAGIAMMPTVWYNENSAVSRNAGTLAADGQAVDLLEDLSGHRRCLTNKPASGGYPTFNAQTQSLAFNAKQSISGNFAAIAQPDTVFVVVKSNTTAANGYVYDSTSNPQRQILAVSATKWYFGSGVWVSDQPVQPGAVTVQMVTYNGSNSAHRINGYTTFTGNLGANPLNGLRIGGAWSFTGTEATGFNGEISEFILYSGSMTEQDIAAVEDYLYTKWTDRIGIFESSGSTTIKNGAITDTYTVYLYGTPTDNVDVTITPAGDNAAEVDLGNGAGQPITVQFTPTDLSAKTVTVTASQVPIDGTVRNVTLSHSTASLDADYNNAVVGDVIVVVTGDDPYCGQTGTTYSASDLDKNCYVDIDDLGVLATNWLDCTDPADQTNCIVP